MWHLRQCTLLPLPPVPENETMLDTLPPLGLQRVKIVALAVADLNRAHQFYGRQLGLPPAFEGGEPVGW
jgi:catechol-2,3-dioxygenase